MPKKHNRTASHTASESDKKKFFFFLKVQMVVRLAEAEGPFNFDEAAGKH